MLKRKFKILVVSLLVLITLTSYYFIKETGKFNKESVETNIANSEVNANEKLKQEQDNKLNEEINQQQENIANEESASTQGVSINKVKPGEIIEYEIVDCEITWDAEENCEEEILPNKAEDYGQDKIYKLIDNEAKADKEFIDKIVAQIEIIPDDTIETFIQEGWRICITNENLKDKLIEPDGELLRDDITITGLMEISEDTIYLYNVGLTIINNTVIHEFGHYTDRIHGWPSLEPEFKSIYNNERQLIKSDSVIGNARELYAEAYKRIMLKEDTENLEAYEYVKESFNTPNLKKTS